MPVTLTIDGRNATVPEGTNLIEAAATVGVRIPHFCYHPHLRIAGNCRMCLVQIEGARGLEIACNTLVREGMVVRTTTPDVLRARRATMELLLLNHPLDCPICDQAGECLLQDHYQDHARHPSRRHEPRITREKRKDIGDHLVLDQERCIACSRCVRFCEDVTETADLSLLQRSDHVLIDVFPGRPIRHGYQFCLADICPVGALTPKEHRFRKRAWYLEETPSLCTGCATGCNIRVCVQGETVFRYLPCRNDAVNRSWMCDVGRLSWKDRDHPDRPLLARLDGLPLTLDAALTAAATWLRRPRVGLVLGAQATLEANFALLFLHDWVLPGARLFGCPGIDPGQGRGADDLLVHADKNPNSRGLDALLTGRRDVEGGRSLARALQANELDALLVLHDDVLGRLDLQTQVPVLWLGWRPGTTSAAARLVIPTTHPTEEDGTLVNAAGRAQRLRAAVPPRGDARPAVALLDGIAARLGTPLGLPDPATALARLAEVNALFAGLTPVTLGELGVPLPEGP